MGKIIIEAASIAEALAMLTGSQSLGAAGSAGEIVSSLNASGIPAAITAATASAAPQPAWNPADVARNIMSGSQPQTSEQDEDNAPANPNAPAVDSTGIRWDERIHSSNKAQNGDGSWRKRRGVQEALIASVEAELKATAAPAAQSQPAPLPMPVMPTSPAAAAAPAPVPMGMPVMPTPPVPVEQPQPVAAYGGTVDPNAPMDFSAFMVGVQKGMTTINTATGTPYIDAGYLKQLTDWIGINNITEVASDPAKIAQALGQLRTDGRWLTA